MEQTDKATGKAKTRDRPRAGRQKKRKGAKGAETKSLLAPSEEVERATPPLISEANYKNASCAAETYA